MAEAGLPPAYWNDPPAYRSLPDTASASAPKLIVSPEPRFVHVPPFHLAMLVAATAAPPLFVADVNKPPAYRSPPDAANACTYRSTPPPTPEPSADHVLPSHLAMPLTGVLPALVKLPPA